MKDRHGRGLRGPLSLPNPFTHSALKTRPTKMASFAKQVSRAVHRIRTVNPAALSGVNVGISDVPTVSAWHIGQVPLASATAATKSEAAQVVLFRRPLELRATDVSDLGELVFQTLAQQLSELTGIPLWEIAPDLDRD